MITDIYLFWSMMLIFVMFIFVMCFAAYLIAQHRGYIRILRQENIDYIETNRKLRKDEDASPKEDTPIVSQ